MLLIDHQVGMPRGGGSILALTGIRVRAYS
jgi:hypothetical protein